MAADINREAGARLAGGSIAVSVAECACAFLARRPGDSGAADYARVDRFVELLKPHVYELVVLAALGHAPDLPAIQREIGVAAADAARIALDLATQKCDELAFAIVATVGGAVSVLASLA